MSDLLFSVDGGKHFASLVNTLLQADIWHSPKLSEIPFNNHLISSQK